MKERYVHARTIDMARRDGGQLAMDNALAELRQRAAPEGHCFQNVQAIIVSLISTRRARSAIAITFLTSLTGLGKGDG